MLTPRLIFLSLNRYQKRFFLVRNQQKIEELKKTTSYKLYQGFLYELLTQVYLPNYDKFHEAVRFDKDYLLEDLSKYHQDLYMDLLSPQSIVAAISLAELIDKVTDGEIVNTFCLLLLAYRYPLNLKLSPLSIGISFFNYKQLLMPNPAFPEEKLYSKETLPKITYICFSGFYSEIDIDVLCEFSKNVQIIMLYDRETGGPVFWEENSIGIYQNDARSKKKDIFSLNDNVLLLPMDSSGGKINSKNIYDLFDYTVYKSIRKFKPEIVLINHSFNFGPEQAAQSKAPFILKAKTWSKILYEICVAANYKVMILPHKLINLHEYCEDPVISETTQHLKHFSQTILPKFSDKFVEKSFEEYFIGSVEVLSSKQIIFMILRTFSFRIQVLSKPQKEAKPIT